MIENSLFILGFQIIYYKIGLLRLFRFVSVQEKKNWMMDRLILYTRVTFNTFLPYF